MVLLRYRITLEHSMLFPEKWNMNLKRIFKTIEMPSHLIQLTWFCGVLFSISYEYMVVAELLILIISISPGLYKGLSTNERKNFFDCFCWISSLSLWIYKKVVWIQKKTKKRNTKYTVSDKSKIKNLYHEIGFSDLNKIFFLFLQWNYLWGQHVHELFRVSRVCFTLFAFCLAFSSVHLCACIGDRRRQMKDNDNVE